MSISRRDALLGATAAAVVTGATTAPLAIKAGATKAALGGEPLVALERHMLVLGAFLDNHSAEDDAQSEAVFKQWSTLQDQIAETPARTVQGLAVKLRLIAEDSMVHCMDSDFEQGLIRSAVESAEQLAVGAEL